MSVRVDGFEPPKSETPDLQSGANYRIDNTPICDQGEIRTLTSFDTSA